MREWRGYRQPLSVQEIGHVRFAAGVASALGFAVAFYLFFGGVRDIALFTVHLGPVEREILRSDAETVLNTFLSTGEQPLRLSYWHNLFAAGIAVAVAQSVAHRVWLTHRGWNEHPQTRRHRTWSLTWSVMWTWLAAWLVLKIGFSFALYESLLKFDSEAERELAFSGQLAFLLAAFAIAVFLEQWKGLRLTYRCGQWLGVAAVLSVVMALLLALVSPLGV